MPIKPGSNRQSAKSRKRGPRMYDLRKWRRLRDEFAKANPLCAECERQGKIELGREVDHIEPHRNDPNLMWDWGNLQHLCRDHHMAKTRSENAKPHRASILPGFIREPSKPLIVVCGPPCAGKSTYVSRNARDDDLVLDLDVIAQEVVGIPLSDCTEQERYQALRERNSMIAEFCEGLTDHPRCFLIATAGKFKHRKFWESKGANVVVINPGIDECLLRLEERQWLYPSEVKKQASAIKRWA